MDNPATVSGRLAIAHVNVKPSGTGHVDQRVQPEQIDLAAHQIRNAWLRDPEKLRDLRLAHFGLGKVALQRRHLVGAQFHVFCLLRRVFDGVPDTGKSLITH